MLSSLLQRKGDRSGSTTPLMEVKVVQGSGRAFTTSGRPLEAPGGHGLAHSREMRRPLHHRTASTSCAAPSFSSYASHSAFAFPSPLEQHRAANKSRSSPSISSSSPFSSSSPRSPFSMAAVAPPLVDFQPSYLPASVVYAQSAQNLLPSSSKNRKKNPFRRISRNVSPFSSSPSTPSLTSSPYNPAYSPATSYASSPCLSSSPDRALPSPPTGADKPRRVPRKPVPTSLAQEAQAQEEEAAAVAAAKEEHSRLRRQRLSRTQVQLDDGLWSTTCDDSVEPSGTSSRRSSAASSFSISSSRRKYSFPVDPEAATAAMILSTSARRASIPSPSAVAANEALSPRLARIAAFSNTVSSSNPDAVVSSHALETSFDLPELELPWLPTLFPEGTPLLSGALSPVAQALAAFPSPPTAFSPSPRVPSVTPPSPTLSGSTCYPSSSSSSSSSDGHSDARSISTCSTLPTPPFSTSLTLPASSTRKSFFRVQAANGAQLFLSSPSVPSSSSPASTCKSTSEDGTPRLPSLDFGDLAEKFSTPMSTPLGEHEDRQLGHGLGIGAPTVQKKAEASSWTEQDEEEGEVLVIALTPKLT